MLAVCISKRRHPDLHERFADYFPTPYGFTCVRKFHENAKVVCALFTRVDTLPRALRVPGRWWVGCPRHLANSLFDGVVVARESSHLDHANKVHDWFLVYVPSESYQLWRMRGDAVAAYAHENGLITWRSAKRGP